MNLSPVKTGLVGLRFGAGLVNIRLFGTDNEKFVNITAVCDLDQDKADAFAAEHGIPAYYDLDKMLADADIEAVMLMTPPAGRTADRTPHPHHHGKRCDRIRVHEKIPSRLPQPFRGRTRSDA